MKRDDAKNESDPTVDELRRMVQAAKDEAKAHVVRNAELIKRIDRLNERISEHVEELERRRREGG